MDKLNKNEIIDLVSEEALVSKRDAREAIEKALEIIEEAFLSGKEVNLTNFGTFVPIVKKERIGTDPKTHKQITIAEKKTIVFRPSKTLKAKL